MVASKIFSSRDVRIHEMNIPGYQLFRKDRSRNGGAVTFYVRNVFNVVNKMHLVSNELEAVCIEIVKPKSKPVQIVSIFRAPNSGSEFTNNFEGFLNDLDNKKKERILIGDLNCDLLSNASYAYTDRLIEILNSYQLEQMITDPTRLTNCSESLIDILATNRRAKLLTSGVLHIGISDHSFVFGCFKIAVPKTDPKLIERRNIKNYREDLLRRDLLML